MILTRVNGRSAGLEYLDQNFNATASKAEAAFLKIVYSTTGEEMFAKRYGLAWQLVREWDESEHPRDEDGKFGFGGGGSSDAAESGGDGGDKGKHPGEGYSAGARVDSKGVIHTSSVYDAQRALSENRKVELNQPRSVSVLLKRLGEVAQKMIAAGQDAPVFNLCNVSVKGTNLFCADTKGILRVEMPQLDDDQTKAFVKHLKESGFKVEKDKVRANHLRATQNELNGVKVANTAEKMRGKEGEISKRLVVSKDDYILDGHHHWAAKVGLDAEDGSLTNDTKVRISRVNITITKLLEEAEKFTGGKGKIGVDAKSLGDIIRGMVREWEEKEFDESKHPRDERGRFGEGGGGSDESQGLTGAAVDEFLDKYGLHAEDQQKISAWLGSGYRELRNDPSFAKTLEKLPKYSGRVYRGTRLAEKDLAKLKPGTTYNMAKFSSSSPRSTVAENYMKDAQRYAGDKKITVMMEINDAGRKLPRDMAGYYGSDAEEVVLMQGDKYNVTAVEPAKDDDGNPFVRVKMSHAP